MARRRGRIRVRARVPAARVRGDDQRGLPVPERVDAVVGRRGAPSRARIHPRRRVRVRLGFERALRWRASRGARRCRRRDAEPPSQRIRLSLPGSQPAARRACRQRQLRSARPGARAAVGSRQHRRFRRQPGLRHGIRPIRGRRKDRDTDGDAGRVRAIPSCGHDERPAGDGIRSAQRSCSHTGAARGAGPASEQDRRDPEPAGRTPRRGDAGHRPDHRQGTHLLRTSARRTIAGTASVLP